MDYFEPKSVDEALSLLIKYGEQAKVVAGGTDVMVDIKYKEEPGSLINIKKIPGLGGIQENGASLRIGPLTTIREIETSALVRDKLPVLWEASHQFASLQIRNPATICWRPAAGLAHSGRRTWTACRRGLSSCLATCPPAWLRRRAETWVEASIMLYSMHKIFPSPGRSSTGS